ncbi:hypothetical protein [Demequina gelatinilytica]|uniref:hypothetical protein n=1 Tax=Demequina gelatinilytica TaxID=1638980 RepID=UPI0007852144|nr:hypothetical protein [Demequina gelatinilytica]
MTDVRDLIDFDTPHNYAELLARAGAVRAHAHCTACGQQSDPLPPARLTLIKYRQVGSAKGSSRLYCEDHLASLGADAKPAKRAGRRAVEAPEQQICPTCFMQMPLTGACQNCE